MINTVYILDKSTNNMYFLKGVVSISPNVSKSVTEYPTTEGATMSDHVYRENSTLSMVMFADGMNTITQSRVIPATDYTEDQVTAAEGEPFTYEQFKSLLQYWENTAVRVDIQTAHRLFKNMTLTGISWSESGSDWTKFKPTLTFQEIKIASLVQLKVDGVTLLDNASYSEETETGDVNGNTDPSVGEVIGGTLAGVATGAGIGAAIGSIIPGVGTAAGAAVGGLIGGVVGFFGKVFG